MTTILYCVGLITNTADAGFKPRQDSLYNEWHNKLEEAKYNYKKWEESAQSYLYFKDRPQLFDIQNASHAAAVKNKIWLQLGHSLV